jgi:Leucine-rich repeat (LRR) protein
MVYNRGNFIYSRNKLQELPESVTFLRNLKSLHVEYNELGRVSERIGKLDKLEDLVSGQRRSKCAGRTHSELPDRVNRQEIVIVVMNGNELNIIVKTKEET